MLIKINERGDHRHLVNSIQNLGYESATIQTNSRTKTHLLCQLTGDYYKRQEDFKGEKKIYIFKM